MKTQRIFVVCLLLAAASMVSAQVLQPGPTDLDHFDCYIAVPPQPQEPVTVLLQDEFDRPAPSTVFLPPVFERVTDISPFRFCNPASKIHNTATTGILHPNAHLLMYWLNNQPSTPRSVTVRNQFTVTSSNPAATSTLHTGAAVILAVPSTKELISTSGQQPLPPPAAAVQRVLDHFKCYIATGDPVNNVLVALGDQFAQVQPTLVVAPILFCNPVVKVRVSVTTGANANGDQNGNGPAFAPIITAINRPLSHLTCYATVSTASFHAQPVLYNNQFVPPGSVNTLQVSLPDLLCVPSFKVSWNVIAPPTSGPMPPPTAP